MLLPWPGAPHRAKPDLSRTPDLLRWYETAGRGSGLPLRTRRPGAARMPPAVRLPNRLGAATKTAESQRRSRPEVPCRSGRILRDCKWALWWCCLDQGSVSWSRDSSSGLPIWAMRHRAKVTKDRDDASQSHTASRTNDNAPCLLRQWILHLQYEYERYLAPYL